MPLNVNQLPLNGTLTRYKVGVTTHFVFIAKQGTFQSAIRSARKRTAADRPAEDRPALRRNSLAILLQLA